MVVDLVAAGFVVLRLARLSPAAASRIHPGVGVPARPIGRSQLVGRDPQRLSPQLLDRLLDEETRAAKAQWILDNDPELSERAAEWGYLSASDLNTAAILKAGSEQPEPEEPQPESRTPSLENQMMARLFLEGRSFTQIASQTNLSRGAVAQRLRRHFGGSPAAARDRALTTA